MNMIQHVDKYPMYNIFDRDARFYYFIPKYQRSYTWGYNEWDNLFNDLYENSEGYFIGSIICINLGDAIKPYMEVIDGQQRLTTLSLLLAAIYSQLKDLPIEDEDYDDTISTLKRSLRCKTSPNQMRLVPQIQEYNLDDYNQLMGEIGLRESTTQRKPYYIVRKLYRCYKYFMDRLSKIIEGVDDLEEKNKRIQGIYEKVKSAMVVKIEVSSHSDAYVLFESLNNRGTPLTAIDLMKNLIMANAESSGLSTEECFEQWGTLLKDLSDNYQAQERFFRQNYNAFRNTLNIPFSNGEKKKYPLGYVATKSNLLNIYEKLIKHDLKAFLKEILICGRIYSQFIYPLWTVNSGIHSKSLTDLLHIQGAPSYVLLLYLFRNQDELQLTNAVLEKIINILSIFFVHRNVTDYPNTRDLTRIFMDIISDIEDQGLKNEDIYKHLLSILKDSCLSDTVFEQRLRGNIYKDNVDVTRYLLCSLAESEMTNENHNNLWDRQRSGAYVWTIEHIFPEGEKIPQVWVDMIADGDKVLANEYLEKYVHTIGNLTMTGYNSTLSNLSYERKRDRQDKEGRYVGYRNGLSINATLAEKDKWTVDDIQNRTDVLIQKLLKLFSFPEE